MQIVMISGHKRQAPAIGLLLIPDTAYLHYFQQAYYYASKQVSAPARNPLASQS